MFNIIWRNCVLILLFSFYGCTVSATKEGDTMTMRGFGAKEASWPSGHKLKKGEPVKIPDLTPIDLLEEMVRRDDR